MLWGVIGDIILNRDVPLALGLKGWEMRLQPFFIQCFQWQVSQRNLILAKKDFLLCTISLPWAFLHFVITSKASLRFSHRLYNRTSM